MRKNSFSTCLVPGILVAVVAVGSVLLVAGAASAAPPAGTLGTLTFTPATGMDIDTPINVNTSDGCPADAEDNAANAFIVGPVGSANPTFPAASPFPMVPTTGSNFSTTSSFGLVAADSLKASAQAAKDSKFGGSGTLQTGEYDVTVHCVNALRGTEFGTFTGAIFFTDPTHYNTGAAPNPSPSQSPSPSPSPSVDPSPSPSPSPSASPAPSETPTPTPTPTTTPESTTTPDPSMNDNANTGAPSDPSGNTHPLGSTGTLANTGAPIARIFLGGLILLTAGLMTILVRGRIPPGDREP